MGKELDRATAFNVRDELDLERKIGGYALALPYSNILLKNTFHSGEIHLRHPRNMKHLQRHLNPNPSTDLAGFFSCVLLYLFKGC